jgi:DNA-binding LacI/PurR family transcriptional regulator
MGVDVPSELSIVAGDDSPPCELVHPPLTALSRDIAAYGAHAARTLARVASGETVGHFQEESPVLTLRGGTASPRWPPPEGPGEVLGGTFALR